MKFITSTKIQFEASASSIILRYRTRLGGLVREADSIYSRGWDLKANGGEANLKTWYKLMSRWNVRGNRWVWEPHKPKRLYACYRTVAAGKVWESVGLIEAWLPQLRYSPGPPVQSLWLTCKYCGPNTDRVSLRCFQKNQLSRDSWWNDWGIFAVVSVATMKGKGRPQVGRNRFNATIEPPRH